MHARKQIISTALDLYTLVYQRLRGVTPNNDYRLFAPKHPDTNMVPVPKNNVRGFVHLGMNNT